MENTEYKDYFISNLNKGQEFKVCFMTTDKSKHLLTKINKFKDNCHIDIYNNLCDFVFKSNKGVFNRQYMGQNYTDYDLIILDDYNIENWKLKYIEDVAMKITKTTEKQVTIGYTFPLSFDKRTKEDYKHLRIITFDKDGNELEEEIPIKVGNVCNILDIISYKHNNIEKPKTLKK